MNGESKASISIIDPDSSSNLHMRLSQTLESIRSQLQTRRGLDVNRRVDSPRMSETLTRARSLHKQLCVARIREANLQDEIDHMKNELADRNAEIAELRSINEELKLQLGEARTSACYGNAEQRVEHKLLNDKLKLADLDMSSIRGYRGNEDASAPTPPASSRFSARPTSPDHATSATIILNRRSYRPATCPIRLTSSYIPDISRHFRNARVVTEADPLFRVYSRS